MDVEPSIVNSRAVSILDQPPSCVAFAPMHPDFLIIGTYQLEVERSGGQNPSAAQTRTGSLVLFELTGQQLHCRETLYTDRAILDIRFAPDQSAIFAVATSQGTVGLYSLSLESPSRIKEVRSFSVCDSSIMVLSIAWSLDSQHERRLGASLSDGRLALLSYDPCQCSVKLVRAHSMEAWAIAWSVGPDGRHQGDLYSGGDDSLLCRHRPWFQSSGPSNEDKEAEDCLRLPNVSQLSPHQRVVQQAYKPSSTDFKTHGAGVTAILPMPTSHGGHPVVLTGSYDGYARVLTLAREKNRASLLAEAHLSGGVWSLKGMNQLESDNESVFCMRVLASCMHAGPRVIQITQNANETWSIRILTGLTEHESMNYASDVKKRLPGEEGKDEIIVSSSFYDKKLCLWNSEAA